MMVVVSTHGLKVRVGVVISFVCMSRMLPSVKMHTLALVEDAAVF